MTRIYVYIEVWTRTLRRQKQQAQNRVERTGVSRNVGDSIVPKVRIKVEAGLRE